MKSFKIIFPPDANYEEVVDTIADVFEAGIAIGKALGDGFQLSDLFAIVQQEPKIREVVEDFPLFIEQFTKLSPVTAAQAVVEAKRRVEGTTGPLGKVAGFIFKILANLAGGYEFAFEVYQGAVAQIEAWKTLFDKDVTTPANPTIFAVANAPEAEPDK